VDAQHWDERYRDTPALWGGPNAILEPLLAALAPGRAVDLACGDGRHTAWLAARGWRAHGVDFSAEAIAQARARTADRSSSPDTSGACSAGGATYEVADVRNWRPAAPVDLVLIAYLHLPAEERAILLRSALDWLAPNGRLTLLAHAEENLAYGVGGPQDAAILPRIEELAAELSGTRVHRLQHVGRSVDGQEALDVLVDVSPWPPLA
jgi:SAM-dependent methyltransferase